jgi:hypothetical protein
MVEIIQGEAIYFRNYNESFSRRKTLSPICLISKNNLRGGCLIKKKVTLDCRARMPTALVLPKAHGKGCFQYAGAERI